MFPTNGAMTPIKNKYKLKDMQSQPFLATKDAAKSR